MTALAQNLAQVYPLRSPVGGLNFRDGLANMPPLDCYLLDNLLPGQTSLKLRRGYRSFATGMGTGTVETLDSFSSGATKKMLAGANGQIYDCSVLGAATSLKSGFTNNYWSTLNFRSRLMFYNGADTPQQYDGTTVADAVYTGSGLTPSTLVHGNIYRSRLYLTQKNTLKYWYGGVDSIAGALTEIDISGLVRNGGQIMFTATWTRDSGNGMDDYFIIVTDQGELLMYSGANPGDSTWGLVGRFVIPHVVGRRAYTQLGGDLVLLTTDGAFPLSALTQYGNLVQSTRQVSDLINPAFKQLVDYYGDQQGWDAIVYPGGYYLMLNVPYTITQAFQYVCNLQTGRWCRFSNMNGYSWALFDGGLYFGGLNGTVNQADYGNLDGSNGIFFQAGQAFNLFEDNNSKLFSMMRPMITLQGGLTFNLVVVPDFSQFNLTNAVLGATANASPWNSSPWNTSPWTVNQTVLDWYDCGTFGRYGSVLIKGTTSNTPLEWHNTDILIEPSESIV